jgi:hypothetical protein
MEFIPASERESASPTVLRTHQLEVGQEYFLVLSNWAGLLRYNIDDRVRVTGRLGQSPVFEFLSRGVSTANITGEKITEHQVVEAMKLAAVQAGVQVDRFVMQGHFTNLPFYQLRVEGLAPPAAAQLANYMDKALADLNVEYQSKRTSGRLGPIRPILLSPGTLEQAETTTIQARHGRSEQYKHQYLQTEIVSDQ